MCYPVGPGSFTAGQKKKKCIHEKQTTDAFYDYKYNEADLGLAKYIRSMRTEKEYKNLTVKEFTKAAEIYETDHPHEQR